MSSFKVQSTERPLPVLSIRHKQYGQAHPSYCRFLYSTNVPYHVLQTFLGPWGGTFVRRRRGGGNVRNVSIRRVFLNIRRSCRRTRLHTRRRGETFTHARFFHVSGFKACHLHVLPVTPGPSNSPAHPNCRCPIRRLLLRLRGPTAKGGPRGVCIAIAHTASTKCDISPVRACHHVTIRTTGRSKSSGLTRGVTKNSFKNNLGCDCNRYLCMFSLNRQTGNIRVVALSRTRFGSLSREGFGL